MPRLLELTARTLAMLALDYLGQPAAQ